jgi:7-cyano-7-deazaguanine tRNA-ribosyltransferase
MSWQEQELCFSKTMKINLNYQHNGYIPVVHIGKYLNEYTRAICADGNLSRKKSIALGGIVPNLLRKPRAMPYTDILNGLLHVRDLFAGKAIHVFGVGGTATLHLIALLGFDSVDSSGWRNRAARGVIQLPGSGERIIAELGNWRGRRPSDEEWRKLSTCRCPACQRHGLDGLKANKLEGFCNRATHNLWILLQEVKWLKGHIRAGTYENNYSKRLDNSRYRPLVGELLKLLEEGNTKESGVTKKPARDALPAQP